MTNPKGTWFESKAVDWLRRATRRPEIERLPRKGKNDVGDIGGVRALGFAVVVDAKCVAKLDLAGWVQEAQAELENAKHDAALRGLPQPIAAVVLHKRKGKGERQMGEQYVTMTAADFVAILTGRRPEE